jgi:hypothetical protein
MLMLLLISQVIYQTHRSNAECRQVQFKLVSEYSYGLPIYGKMTLLGYSPPKWTFCSPWFFSDSGRGFDQAVNSCAV